MSQQRGLTRSLAPSLGSDRQYSPAAEQYERAGRHAYMEEAERFDWLVAMNAGEVWQPVAPKSCGSKRKAPRWKSIYKSVTASTTAGASGGSDPPYQPENAEIAIEARDLTMRLVPSLPLITSIFAFHAGRFLVSWFERLR